MNIKKYATSVFENCISKRILFIKLIMTKLIEICFTFNDLMKKLKNDNPNKQKLIPLRI